MPRLAAYIPVLLAPVALLLHETSLVRADTPSPSPAPSVARAALGGHVDVDLDIVSSLVPVAPPAFGLGRGSAFPAYGVGGRFGWRFDLGPVWLQPEAGGYYAVFGPWSCVACAHTHAERVLGGLRLGGSGLISGVIEPALFAHAGYGWISDQDPGLALDVGFAFDVAVVPHFRFGAHGAYEVTPVDIVTRASNSTGVSSVAARWISYGVHAGASF